MGREVKAEVTDAERGREPVFPLLERVRGPIVQNEDQVLDAASKGLRKGHLRHNGLDIDQALATVTDSVDLAIGKGKPGN